MVEPSTRHERRRVKPRRRVSVVGVLGELLITAGVFVLLFLGWQVWLNDIIVGNQQHDQAISLSEQWDKGEGQAPEPVDPGIPVVGVAPGNAERFAILYVPRFGSDYARPIAEGVGTTDVLNKYGLGHYPKTQMPGEVGNFAIAAHRKAYGGNLEHIHELQVGDAIFVETADGWYKYSFRNLEYVQPTGVGVIAPVPQLPESPPTDRFITLTSCNPFFSTAERIIAYGVFDTWYPRAGGPPEDIAALVQAAGGS
jgi:sortase A